MPRLPWRRRERREMLLDYAGCAYPVVGLGPGNRLAIWVRGCQRRCVGCIAPELWASGSPTPVTQVADDLAPYLSQADGLTISGGEPFDQAPALVALLDVLRATVDIEVLVYTGYPYDELITQDARSALLQRIDLLIDGPFRVDLPNTLQWRGSDNQQVRLLTPRAQRYAEMCALPMPEQRPLQLQMLDATHYRLIGIPRRGDLSAYREAMAAKGLPVAPDMEE